MRLHLVLAALFACSTRSADGPGGTDAPKTTLPTTDTDPTTVDTEPQAPYDAVIAESPPRAMVYGLPGMGIALDFSIVPAWGSDPGLLLALNNPYTTGIEPFDAYPQTFVLSGDIPAGEHLVTELWDGTSSFESAGELVIAGDVNDDGHLDAWIDRLYLGPFLGKHTSLADAVAWIDSPHAYFDGVVELADFDANGDGHEDVLFVPCCQMGIIRYGPFEGPMSSYWDGFDPTDMTLLGDETGCDNGPRHHNLLPDHFGPGKHAVSIVTGYGCYPDTHVYDLMQPPGTRVAPLQAVAIGEGGSPIRSASDINGDGFSDVFTAYGLLPGPVSGGLWDIPEMAVTPKEEVGVSYEYDETRALGDLDGDGITELLVLYRLEPNDNSTWRYVVLFSPYDEDPPRPRAVSLGKFLELGIYSAQWAFGDLDGDGLPDIVQGKFSDEKDDPPASAHLFGAGELRIWYASDLVAAYQAALAPAD